MSIDLGDLRRHSYLGLNMLQGRLKSIDSRGGAVLRCKTA